MTEHIWFEVRLGGMSTSHATLEEAKSELKDMRTGYKTKHPETDHFFTEENRAYWKRVGKKAVIQKVTQTAEEIK